MSHHRIRPMRRLVTALFIASTPLLAGCIVTEIRDEMASVNANLQPLHDQIETGNETLARLEKHVTEVEKANTLLEDGNEQVAAVGKQLEIMESIQASLVSIDTSLQRLDEHLASLRGTIDNIDSTIPFLKISGDEEPEQTVTEDAADQPGG